MLGFKDLSLDFKKVFFFLKKKKLLKKRFKI